MKILFLDVDGVLNYRMWFGRPGNDWMYTVDPACIERVHKIIEATGVKIVLSSTWRNAHESREIIRSHIPFIDITPNISSFRGDEIKAWLDKHPEVTKYAILDDDDDMHPDQKLFDTSFDVGLTDEITQDIIDYFNS